MSKNWVNWIVYTVLRLAVFVVPLVIMLALNVPEYIAVIFAAIVGVALSVLLLSKWRGAASASIYERRVRKGTVDRDRAAELGQEEDAAVDAALHEAGYVTQEPAETPANAETPARAEPAEAALREGEGQGGAN